MSSLCVLSLVMSAGETGRLVILYISIGVVCGAAVIIMMLLIWRSRIKKRKATHETQMNHSTPDHDRCTASDVESTESLYENVTMNRSRCCDIEMSEPVYENTTIKYARRLVILYISIGVVCGAAVIIMMLLIWC
ncbi:B-cell receptor CD22-like protein [Labeo rohita]|uniref:B-cell receptor CD22-like protein n=1 Tax=Labeo rohita TaxID=84645 RepID=A0A498M3W1_LABRO|nr:B-cell receptor CD22-like protein [Labeo rohita]